MENPNDKNRGLRKVVLAALVLTAVVAKSQAATGDFDSTTAIGVLTAGIVTVAAMVGGIIAISGGMDVYAKVRGFFKRAK